MTHYQIVAVCVAACVALSYAWPLIKSMTPAVVLQHLFAVIAAVVLVVAFIPPKDTAGPSGPQSKVQTILKSASQQDKARVRAYYTAMADVVSRDDHIIATVGKWRKANADALDLAFKGTDLPGKYSGLDVAIDELLVKAIGKDDVALTDEKRAALVAALKEVANAAR